MTVLCSHSHVIMFCCTLLLLTSAECYYAESVSEQTCFVLGIQTNKFQKVQLSSNYLNDNGSSIQNRT